MINKLEHEIFEFDIANFSIELDGKPENLLGLNEHHRDEGRIKVQANYYAGFSWIDNSFTEFLFIQSKLEKLDYLKIFSVCLSDPIVSKHLDKTYKINFDAPLIEIGSLKVDFDITILLIKHFLVLLKRISQKGLKKGYVKTSENLTGKVRGRINVNQTNRKNLSTSRQDKVWCDYQIYTTDCLENQLLKTALKQVSRYLYDNIKVSDDKQNLFELLKYNQTAFDMVSVIEVFYADFKKIRHSAFYSEYKQALKVAEMIFRRLGFNNNIDARPTKIPPFYIDMPELFERYVEVLLRRVMPDLLVGYDESGYSETKTIWKMRPDFIIPSLNAIVDAKYKEWHSKKSNVDFKSDFQQLALYTRTNSTLQKMECFGSIYKSKLIFIFPNPDCPNEIDLGKIETNKEADFYNIYKVGVSLPVNS